MPASESALLDRTSRVPQLDKVRCFHKTEIYVSPFINVSKKPSSSLRYKGKSSQENSHVSINLHRDLFSRRLLPLEGRAPTFKEVA